MKARVRKRGHLWEVSSGTYGTRYTGVTVGTWQEAMNMANRSAGSPDTLFDIGLLSWFGKSLDREFKV